MSALTKDQKMKSIVDTIPALEKQLGPGIISRYGSKKIVPIDVIPTGVFGVDNYVLGVGGIPRGRFTEVFGPEGSGKTTLALQAVAEAQKTGLAAYVDAEHALDLKYAAALGVDVPNLLLSQPDYGEQALSLSEAIIETGNIDILVVDSVAALVPKAELDGEMEDANVGLHARLMSKAMRKLVAVTHRTNTAVIWINQIREKIGVMFGNPETTTGGRALRFYASVRIDVRRIQGKKDGDIVVANRTKFKAVKNKVATPYRECEADIVFGQGIDGIGSVIDFAIERAVIEKSGSWLSFKGERIGQGKDNAVAFLKDNVDLLKKVHAETTKAMEAA